MRGYGDLGFRCVGAPRAAVQIAKPSVIPVRSSFPLSFSFPLFPCLTAIVQSQVTRLAITHRSLSISTSLTQATPAILSPTGNHFTPTTIHKGTESPTNIPTNRSLSSAHSSSSLRRHLHWTTLQPTKLLYDLRPFLPSRKHHKSHQKHQQNLEKTPTKNLQRIFNKH